MRRAGGGLAKGSMGLEGDEDDAVGPLGLFARAGEKRSWNCFSVSLKAVRHERAKEAYGDGSSFKDGHLGREVVNVSVSTRVCKGDLDELREVGGGFEARHIYFDLE